MQVNTRDGIFAPEGYGGGVFNGNVAFGAYGNVRECSTRGLGQFVIDVPPQCFDNDAFRDCYYQYLGYAQSECADLGLVRDMYGGNVMDCIRDLVQVDVWSRCVPQHCPGQAASPGVPKYEPYPLDRYSEQTKALQEDLNVILARNNCETLKVDGKLGPKTCGAARWADPGMVPPTCKSFTDPVCEEPAEVEEPTPVVTPIGPGPGEPELPIPVAPQPKKLSMAWMAIGGLALAAAVGGGLYAMKKKKKGGP